MTSSVKIQNAGTPQMTTSTVSSVINQFMIIRWPGSDSIRLLEIELLLSNTYLDGRSGRHISLQLIMSSVPFSAMLVFSPCPLFRDLNRQASPLCHASGACLEEW